MRKVAIALVLAGVFAGAALTVEAKSIYYVYHWNEGSNSYSYLKLDYKGCSNHLYESNHYDDYGNC